MAENRRQILDLLAEGKITAEEAERMLYQTEQQTGGEISRSDGVDDRKPPVKCLRVIVEPAPGADDGERVNVRVPIALIRAGVRLSALIPMVAVSGINAAMKDKGIDVDVRNINPEDLEQIVDALGDLEVDVENKRQKVRVYVEQPGRGRSISSFK